jgi:hypothetical protein
LGLFLILVVSVSGGSALWRSFRAEAQRTGEIQRIRAAGLSELKGVRFGMTEAEVRYVLGENYQDSDLASLGSDVLKRLWTYPDAPGYIDVMWSEDKRVIGVSCQKSTLLCPEVATLGIRSSEQDVLTTLGEPVKDLLSERGQRTLCYGPADSQLCFDLERRLVTGMSITGWTEPSD